MKIKISNHLLLTEIPPGFSRELRERLTIENPKFIENEKMGRWQGETSKYLCYCHETGNDLSIPRGFTGQGLDEGTIERLCIITVDGGLTDSEAEARVLP